MINSLPCDTLGSSGREHDDTSFSLKLLFKLYQENVFILWYGQFQSIIENIFNNTDPKF